MLSRWLSSCSQELLERRAAQKRQEAEEARAKAEVEEAIEVLVEEELGMNPTFGEGQAGDHRPRLGARFR